jgi:hypothetical protein
MATGIGIVTPVTPNAKVVGQNVAAEGDPEYLQVVKAAPSGLLAVGTIQALTVDATAGGKALPSIPTDAEFALVSLETAAIRWTDEGTAPTAAVGHLLVPPSSDSVYLFLEGRARLIAWRGFRLTGTSGAVQVTYYKTVVP